MPTPHGKENVAGLHLPAAPTRRLGQFLRHSGAQAMNASHAHRRLNE